jgi:hypothetical protein
VLVGSLLTSWGKWRQACRWYTCLCRLYSMGRKALLDSQAERKKVAIEVLRGGRLPCLIRVRVKYWAAEAASLQSHMTS